MADNQEQILAAIKAQTRVLEKIEKHLRPKVADAKPVRFPPIGGSGASDTADNGQAEPPLPAGEDYPLGWPFGSRSVPGLPEGVEPMSDND